MLRKSFIVEKRDADSNLVFRKADIYNLDAAVVRALQLDIEEGDDTRLRRPFGDESCTDGGHQRGCAECHDQHHAGQARAARQAPEELLANANIFCVIDPCAETAAQDTTAHQKLLPQHTHVS